MLYWALVFLVVALIAGLFGFGGIASASAGIAQTLFFVFLVLLVISVACTWSAAARHPCRDRRRSIRICDPGRPPRRRMAAYSRSRSQRRRRLDTIRAMLIQSHSPSASVF